MYKICVTKHIPGVLRFHDATINFVHTPICHITLGVTTVLIHSSCDILSSEIAMAFEHVESNCALQFNLHLTF